MNSLKKIKWGIIGCGNIANKFASDLALIDDAELTAVASRSMEKANEFAQKYNSEKAYNSYDALFLDANVDIVYIATPHISHAELSIKAMEHGKHVLCEKPLALNKKEAVAIFETSKRTNRFFMEALWTRFNPSLIAIKKLIDDGEIGEIKFINVDFSFKTDKSLDSRVLNIDLGGGTILDIGIYPAFLVYLLLGVPKEILAKSIFHDTTKCDIQTSIIFHYDTAQAIIYSGFVSKSDLVARISGTSGQIHLHKPWFVAQGYTLIKNDNEQVFNLSTTGIGFSHEIIECHNCLRANEIESDYWSHQHSLDLISILDNVREQVGLKYPQE
ncbi:MAG: Gfo/Idh/MocA family oxidoreductase [Flavobacteriaceae bacterium]|nr:Gfo/Idh/MocA family oxidoreductase [Flavobacteriaceae bacterium]